MRRLKPDRWIPSDSEERRHPDGLGVVYLYYHNRPAAVAYGGKRNKPDWNYSFVGRQNGKTPEEQREARIAEYFASLSASARFKAERRAVNAEHLKRARAALPDSSSGASEEYSGPATAQCIRNVLAAMFPATKFRVSYSSYSGGSSIDVYWTDGPTSKQIDPILDAFSGADFDGMIDLKTHRDASEWRGKRVRFSVDFVHSQRSHSREFLARVADVVGHQVGRRVTIGEHEQIDGGELRVPYQWHPHFADDEPVTLENLQVASDSHPGGGEWLSTLVWRIVNSISLEAPAAEVEIPHQVTEGFIDYKVRELLT